MLETLTSLESSNNGAIANIDEASVRDFLSEIEEFNLTDTEKIVGYSNFWYVYPSTFICNSFF